MTKTISKALLAAAAVASLSSAALAAGGEPIHIERQKWSFAGFGGSFDNAQLQRGFQVYKEVCLSCHGLKRVYFRNLAEPGGPEFPVEAVKALAASWDNKIFDGGDEKGNIADRKGNVIKRDPLPSDPILGPYDNERQAREAQNGALPPDLSNIIKARTIEYHGPWYLHPFHMLRDIVTGYQEAGADYVYALLMGYKDAPSYVQDDKGHFTPVAGKAEAKGRKMFECVSITKTSAGKEECNALSDGMSYNTVYPGNQIAMAAPPLPIDYQAEAGIKGTWEQNSRDVVAFLAWASDPSLEQRKQIGWQVMLYLLITTVLLYLAKKRIWRDAH